MPSPISFNPTKKQAGWLKHLQGVESEPPFAGRLCQIPGSTTPAALCMAVTLARLRNRSTPGGDGGQARIRKDAIANTAVPATGKAGLRCRAVCPRCAGTPELRGADPLSKWDRDRNASP